MGYSHIHIVVYGYELPFDVVEEHREKPSEENDFTSNIDPYRYNQVESGDVIIVHDGYQGEYSYVGIAQFVGEKARGSPETIPRLTLEEPTDNAKMVEVGSLLNKMGYEPDEEPKHHVFTHTV